MNQEIMKEMQEIEQMVPNWARLDSKCGMVGAGSIKTTRRNYE
jgi:hypothetical protein